jgi:hypothetical protein
MVCRSRLLRNANSYASEEEPAEKGSRRSENQMPVLQKQESRRGEKSYGKERD